MRVLLLLISYNCAFSAESFWFTDKTEDIVYPTKFAGVLAALSELPENSDNVPTKFKDLLNSSKTVYDVVKSAELRKYLVSEYSNKSVKIKDYQIRLLAELSYVNDHKSDALRYYLGLVDFYQNSSEKRQLYLTKQRIVEITNGDSDKINFAKKICFELNNDDFMKNLEWVRFVFKSEYKTVDSYYYTGPKFDKSSLLWLTSSQYVAKMDSAQKSIIFNNLIDATKYDLLVSYKLSKADSPNLLPQITFNATEEVSYLIDLKEETLTRKEKLD